MHRVAASIRIAGYKHYCGIFRPRYDTVVRRVFLQVSKSNWVFCRPKLANIFICGIKPMETQHVQEWCSANYCSKEVWSLSQRCGHEKTASRATHYGQPSDG